MDELNVSQLFQFAGNQRIGKFKCRIVYAESIEEFQMLPYQIRRIHSVRLVESNAIDYRFKLEDRQAFSYLKDAVNEDEIIIVQNGQITDTSYSNLVFFDGEKWITPTTYLLNGTMRQSLLQTKQIIEKPIQVEDLNRFESFKLINAMMDLEESPELPISIIV
jgi:4-amino-4-deoxychorismate lyase